MKRKIKLIIVVLSLFLIVTTMVLMTVGFNHLYTGQVEKDLKLIARFMYQNHMTDNISENAQEINVENLRVTILDPEGNVLADNMAAMEEMDNHVDRPEVTKALETGEGIAVRRSQTLKKDTYYYAMRMEDGRIMRVSREADSIFGYIGYIVPGMVLMVLSLFAISFLVLKIREQHGVLLKSSKMRQEFTANVTHELKTPLTSISGYAELIETGLASGEDTIRFAKGIRKSADRLLTLINDIIRLSELDSEEKEFSTEEINLYRLAATCVEMLETNAEKHNVTISMQGEECSIEGNRMMIEELLYNLCDNAIRYNNENGSVLVDVHPADKQVILSVKDTGIGISRNHQERIFERFYRVDKSRSKSTGGTGLGLAIVKHIVEKHHAKLELESEVAQGTTMKVIFENIKGM